MQVDIRVDPALKALVCQLLESTALSSAWFQIDSTFAPYNKGLNFYTMQLRSADEGQTVFYECLKCKFTFSQNN